MIRAYGLLAVLIVIAMVGWSYRPMNAPSRGVGMVRAGQRVRDFSETDRDHRYSNVRYWWNNILPASIVLLGMGVLLGSICEMLKSQRAIYGIHNDIY